MIENTDRLTNFTILNYHHLLFLTFIAVLRRTENSTIDLARRFLIYSSGLGITLFVSKGFEQGRTE